MSNVVEFGARSAATGQTQIIPSLSNLIGDRLVAVFRETLAQCDDILFGHAQKAINGTRQAQFFDDLRQLRLAQAMAVRIFAQACRKAIEGGQIESTARPRVADDPLQLVADEDLEFDLALFRIGKRCDEAAPRMRHQVERRLAIVYGLADGTASPLSGHVIAKLCRAGLTPIDIGLETRLIVLKQLERQLSAVMESLLEATNALLVEHGVLPNLRAAPARAPVASPAPVARALSQQVQAAAAAPMQTVDVRQLGEVLGRVNQWMAQQDAMAGAAAAVADVLPPVESRTPATTPAPAPSNDADAQERERRRLDIQERRAAELQRARELRFAAERSAEQVVSLVLSQAHVPDFIGNVVRGPLRRHLETVHARRGETSTEWRSACKLVRDLAWALDPETASSEESHWRAMVPDIVTALRTTLLSLGTAEHEVDRIVAGFGERYERLLGAKNEAADTIVEPMCELAEAAAVAAPSSQAVPNFGAALRQVRQLVLGRWFELCDDQGRRQRAKLVWTSAMTERCLFVNSHGKLVADRPHARVANDIVNGQFREIEADELALA